MLYTAYMTVLISGPISGADAAKAAWDLSSDDFVGIIPQGAPEIVLHEIRGTFAAWCNEQRRSLFASLEEAWNQFILPRHGLPSPAVLLAGTPCPRCREERFQKEELNRVAYLDCSYCKGHGHLPPRAIPARPAREGKFISRVAESPVPGLGIS